MPDEFTEIEQTEQAAPDSLQKTASLSPAANQQLNELYGRFAERWESFSHGQRGLAMKLRCKAEYYGAMKWKYDRAKSRPWLSVAPDQPEPM
jgi:hypothetical protein